jgi:hypothetical protein
VATQVEPTKAYLQRFESPLWELLDLDSCNPVGIVEGRQQGFAYTLIEMRHLRTGLLGGDSTTTVTTFVAIGLPARVGTRHITHRPSGYEASATGRHVFLAEIGDRARPGEWRELIGSAIEVAQSLQQTQPGQEPARTYAPSGSYFGSIAAAVGCLLLTVAFAASGFGILLGLIESDGSRIGSGFEFLGGALFTLVGAGIYFERARKRTHPPPPPPP